MPVIVSGGSSTVVRVVDGRTVTAIERRGTSVVSQDRESVNVAEQRTQVVQAGTVGIQGPPGPAGADAGEPVTASYTNGDMITLRRGQPVAIVGGQLRLASAVTPRHELVGLIYDESIVPGAIGRVQVAGVVAQPVAEWTHATGMVGGLAQETDYFLAEGGGMTPYPPTDEGLLVVRVGYATSNSEFVIEPGTPIEL